MIAFPFPLCPLLPDKRLNALTLFPIRENHEHVTTLPENESTIYEDPVKGVIAGNKDVPFGHDRYLKFSWKKNG